jgi:hypothetical protein
MGRTIPTTPRPRETRELERLAPPSIHGLQHEEAADDRNNPLERTDRLQPPNSTESNPAIKQRNGGRSDQSHALPPKSSAIGHQRESGTHQTPRSTIRRRSEGLARGQEPSAPLSVTETGP